MSTAQVSTTKVKDAQFKCGEQIRERKRENVNVNENLNEKELTRIAECTTRST
jgi:hypothetical protein